MNTNILKKYNSHGDGTFSYSDFVKIGHNVIIEPGVMVFHPENIYIGNNVYIGHYTLLKGYYKGKLVIGDNSWIGQMCFFHSAGNIEIGKAVGIGPGVKIISSSHTDHQPDDALILQPLLFKPVIIGDGVDIGVNATILPGVKIGEGAIIGAGSVVTKNIPEYAVVAGNPARILRFRK